MDNQKPATVLDSWSSISEKTVFILDRSPYFTHVSSGHSVDGDCLKNSKKTSHLYANEPTVDPFDRSLWTCTIESVVGYSRLVWDLFTPDQRCISILSVTDTTSASVADSSQIKDQSNKFIEKICTWQNDDQNLDHLMKSLAKRSHTHQMCPPSKLKTTTDIAEFPNCKPGSTLITDSLDQALDELSCLTSAQIDCSSPDRASFSSSTSSYNNGRIILISSFKNDDCIRELADNFEKMLEKKNKSFKEAKLPTGSSTSVKRSSINYCDLVIVNTFPIMDEGSCSKIENTNSFRPYLHCKIYSVKSGRMIAGLLNNLCLQHHNLRSTTITGIPMKEEQNASSSSQYDVEIVHCSSIHEDIMNSGSPLLEGVVEVIDRNGFPCDTFKLSWCTPRTTAIELNHCVATSRITAVDVNSRPSACLTNFLLNGRAVMLEIFKSKSHRMTTHILASHNSELYIHSLATTQHKLNIGDPPSISDHLGGKVGDYRMNDFVNFMKQHTLCRSHLTNDPLSKTCQIMKRQTLYWPLTLGHTILLNVSNLLGRLLQLVPKESLNQVEVEECKKAIVELNKFQKEGQALPSVSIMDRIKGSTSNKGGSSSNSGTKLEQLYKLLWNELEYFLRVHSTTAEHEAILDYLIEHNGFKKPDNERGTKRAASSRSTHSSPLKKVKASNQLILEIGDNSVSFQETAMYYKSGMSLWQTWTQLYDLHHRGKNKLPFVGRTNPQALLSAEQDAAT